MLKNLTTIRELMFFKMNNAKVLFKSLLLFSYSLIEFCEKISYVINKLKLL